MKLSLKTYLLHNLNYEFFFALGIEHPVLSVHTLMASYASDWIGVVRCCVLAKHVFQLQRLHTFRLLFGHVHQFLQSLYDVSTQLL